MKLKPLRKHYNEIFICLSGSYGSTELVVVNASYQNEKYSLKPQSNITKEPSRNAWLFLLPKCNIFQTHRLKMSEMLTTTYYFNFPKFNIVQCYRGTAERQKNINKR